MASADITWVSEEYERRLCMQAQVMTDKRSAKLENWKRQLAVDNQMWVILDESACILYVLMK